MFPIFWVFCVEEASHVADHFNAEFAVEIGLSLVEGPYPYSYFHTHNLLQIKSSVHWSQIKIHSTKGYFRE
jgi:hypothetical protein